MKKRKLKIAMLTANFPPYFGGIGNACYHNALELARLGHDVTVFTRKYTQSFDYPKEIKVVQLKKAFEFGNAILLPGLLGIKGFDVLHVHLPFHFGAELASIVSLARNIPLVVSYQMDLVGESWLKKAFWLHEKTLLKLVLLRARKIIVSSKDYAQHSNFAKFFAKRAKDVVAIPNGVDVLEFNPSVKSSDVKKWFRIKKAKRTVLFVGALDKAHYFKGVSFLLKSFSKIKDKESRLVIVGEGELRKKYFDEACWLGVADRILFSGRVSAEDLPKYYSASDLLVLPSVDKGEAFGLVLVEAMASGKPVIASNLPGVRAVVDNKKNGLLFEARNEKDLVAKLDWLLANKKARKRFGITGRKKALQEFDWKKIAKKMERVYFEAMSVKE
jgi:glycosyltransferase involved in cell wall biosynthesis